MSKFLTLHGLQCFIGKRQSLALEELIEGEEGQYFVDMLLELAATIKTMPKTGDTDGQGDKAIVHLRYFIGNFDFWITERDMGDGSADLQQHQAFGFVNLGDPDNAELGYISLPELFASNVELDLNWAPKSLAQVRASI